MSRKNEFGPRSQNMRRHDGFGPLRDFSAPYDPDEPPPTPKKLAEAKRVIQGAKPNRRVTGGNHHRRTRGSR